MDGVSWNKLLKKYGKGFRYRRYLVIIISILFFRGVFDKYVPDNIYAIVHDALYILMVFSITSALFYIWLALLDGKVEYSHIVLPFIALVIMIIHSIRHRWLVPTWQAVVFSVLLLLLDMLKNNEAYKEFNKLFYSKMMIQKYEEASAIRNDLQGNINMLNQFNDQMTEFKKSKLTDERDKAKAEKNKESHFLDKKLNCIDKMVDPPAKETYKFVIGGKNKINNFRNDVLRYISKIEKYYSDENISKKREKLEIDKKIALNKAQYLYGDNEINQQIGEIDPDAVAEAYEQRAKNVDKLIEPRGFFHRKNRKV